MPVAVAVESAQLRQCRLVTIEVPSPPASHGGSGVCVALRFGRPIGRASTGTGPDVGAAGLPAVEGGSRPHPKLAQELLASGRDEVGVARSPRAVRSRVAARSTSDASSESGTS